MFYFSLIFHFNFFRYLLIFFNTSFTFCFDQNAFQDPVSPPNGTTSPRENGLDKLAPKKEHVGPHR